MKKSIPSIWLSALLLWGGGAARAQDTFSITAVDSATGEVGSAGASCLDASDNGVGVVVITDVHPGRGVVHTQSYWNATNQNNASGWMNSGHSPQQIIDSLIAHDAQNQPGIRQYGITDFDSSGHPRTAAFTGVDCFDYKSHITGPYYTIQGNILLGQQILDSMEARFLRASGQPLSCRLMEALQGAKVVGADTRCTTSGNSSLSAFLRIANAQGFYTVDVVVAEGPAGYEPIDSVQSLMDQFYPCGNTALAESPLPTVLLQPNPSTAEVQLLFGKKQSASARLQIHTCEGQLIFEQPVSGLKSLTLPATTFGRAGVYYYLLQNGNHRQRGQLLRLP